MCSSGEEMTVTPTDSLSPHCYSPRGDDCSWPWPSIGIAQNATHVKGQIMITQLGMLKDSATYILIITTISAEMAERGQMEYTNAFNWLLFNL